MAVHLIESVKADLIAYDGADYAPASLISDLNGGAGWNGGWSGINNVVSGSLVMNGVATTGDRFVTDGGNFGSSLVIATTGFEALLHNGRFGKDGSGYQVIWNFQPDGRGSTPESRLLYASDFEVRHDFLPGVPNGGRRPRGGLIKGRDGAFYGATFAGGAENAGTLFALAGTGGPAMVSVILNLVFSAAGRTFRFSVAGASLAQYQVQATDAPPAWQAIGALQAAPDGSAHFSEQVPPGGGSRLYRVVDQ